MSKRKILIVDDERAFTELVKLNLESSGLYHVEIENDAANALFSALRYQPDLILLDIIMDQMEGPDVAKDIRRETTLKNVPIIFLTATVTHDQITEAGGRMKGYPYVPKPSDLDVLMAAIEANLAA